MSVLMIVAVPVFGEEVAPWFCHAREVLVVKVAPRRRLLARTIDVSRVRWQDRFALLAELGVTVIFTNGFNHACFPVAAARGIHVITGITGDIAALLETLRTEGHGARRRKSSLGTSRSSRGR